MNPAGVGSTYWYLPERGGMFMDFDRVAERDEWAWMRLVSPWIQGQFASDSEFNAGFVEYGHARANLEQALGAYSEAKAALQASKLQTGLVLCFSVSGRNLAYVIFPVRRSMAPDQEGPTRFAAWKSRLPGNERSTMLMSKKPKIWPL